jgi:hypothetical protein
MCKEAVPVTYILLVNYELVWADQGTTGMSGANDIGRSEGSISILYHSIVHLQLSGPKNVLRVSSG